jgi:predicted phosphodiesterase
MTEVSRKACRHCKRELGATTENFKPDKKAADGLRASCRPCQRKQSQAADRSRGRVRVDRKLRTLFVLSDTHHPEHDRHVWAATLELLRDVRPDELILAGDFLEMGSVSQHGGALLDKLTEDFNSGISAIKELREAVGADARITYLEGNHESRLSRFLASKTPSLMDSLSIEVGLRLKDYGVEWVPEAKQPVTRGDLDVTHGHQDLRERPSKYHGGKMSEVYGRPNRTIIYGHTHKPQVYTRPTVGGVTTAIGLGCGRTLSPGWLHGAQAGWVHQVAVVYLTDAGRSHVYPITFAHGQAVWQGKLYGAREVSNGA